MSSDCSEMEENIYVHRPRLVSTIWRKENNRKRMCMVNSNCLGSQFDRNKDHKRNRPIERRRSVDKNINDRKDL